MQKTSQYSPKVLSSEESYNTFYGLNITMISVSLEVHEKIEDVHLQCILLIRTGAV